ncbi:MULTISPECIES: helix-turn-helix domain-containing protein [Streptomyces]|uniref:helix-turn-helix domain-containing protein n=1 Tax=Streptomyces TaxID=1883 RepID=UPI0033D31B9E
MEEQEFNAAVSHLIRQARQRAGVTQEHLGRQPGLSRGSITNIEAGTQMSPLYHLARIASALNVQPAELLPLLVPDETADLAAKSSSTIHGRVPTPSRTAESSHQSWPTSTFHRDRVTSS